jgi:hypothetical protein
MGTDFRALANALGDGLHDHMFHSDFVNSFYRLQEDLGVVEPATGPFVEPRAGPTVIGTLCEGVNSILGEIASLTTEVRELRASQQSPTPPADSDEIASLQIIGLAKSLFLGFLYLRQAVTF